MMASVFCAKVLYYGKVQGVGFRYQVYSIAREFDVSGQVRNLPEGSVELIAEGDEDEVRGFLDEIAQQMEVFIRNTEVHTSTRTPECSGFTIAT